VRRIETARFSTPVLPPMSPQTLRALVLAAACASALLLACAPARADDEAGAARPPVAIAPVDDAWRAALPRDAEQATQAYLDRLPAAAVQRSNAYFEGKYALQGVEFLLGLAIAALMLQGRRSARVRDWAQRVGRYGWARDALYGGVYGLAGGVLALPLVVYQGFVREHAYGLATQSFGAWAADWGVDLVVTTLGTMVVVPVLLAVIRRAGERWAAWGALTCVALLTLMLLVKPTWLDPLFNTYKPVEPGPVRTSILAMAHANGVPTNEVYEFDASRQTTRVSANVSGIGPSAAIRLNDNLLRRASEAEIRAVMAHELGHYTLNHMPKLLMQFGLLIFAGFAFSQWALRHLLARRGAAWGLRGVGDAATLPLLAAAFSVFMLLTTPVFNTIIRTQEIEADRFGLALAREPHGFAEAILKLSEYRKPDPGRLEEVVFYDHPSARHRIHDAMRWREAMGTP
jgi:STE24 endopeptidase